ncbi:hypothetical protein FPRO03_10004 [Fusarium proliferatum]|nr:hypothetical protein FPRO03_10004 [Fusarium proliferatum]
MLFSFKATILAVTFLSPLGWAEESAAIPRLRGIWLEKNHLTPYTWSRLSLLQSRQLQYTCDDDEKLCGTNTCIQSDDICCDDGTGTGCYPGTECVPGGCCPIGEKCNDNPYGPADDDDDDEGTATRPSPTMIITIIALALALLNF